MTKDENCEKGCGWKNKKNKNKKILRRGSIGGLDLYRGGRRGPYNILYNAQFKVFFTAFYCIGYNLHNSLIKRRFNAVYIGLMF